MALFLWEIMPVCLVRYLDMILCNNTLLFFFHLTHANCFFFFFFFFSFFFFFLLISQFYLLIFHGVLFFTYIDIFYVQIIGFFWVRKHNSYAEIKAGQHIEVSPTAVYYEVCR